MQLELQLYSGSLGLWSVRRTAGRPVVGKPRGMACRCVARQNTVQRLKLQGSCGKKLNAQQNIDIFLTKLYVFEEHIPIIY